MNIFNHYNNANIIVNNEFIFDPWLYGSLYKNSWFPYGEKTLKKNRLKKIKYCFISHLHQDHWDIDTIKYFPKSTIFIIPKLPVNKIIEIQLKKLNFKNIVYAPIKKFIKIDSKYSISVVRPLNNEGLETKNIIYKDDGLEIDNGCILKINNDNSHHLFLSDNCPYNIKGFIKDYQKIKINSLFFPFNGYASDYPFCYDNFSLKEKKKISNEKNNKLQIKLFKFFKVIKPDLLIPYSSQFTLKNKSEKIFNQVIDKKFLDPKQYSDYFKKKFKIQNISYLKPELSLHIKKNHYKIKSDNQKNITDFNIKKAKYNFPQLNSKYKINDLAKDLNISINLFIERIKKNKLSINKINQTAFFILIKNINKIYYINLKELVCEEFKGKKNSIKNKFKNSLILKTDLNIIGSILNRKLHMNNCIIGCWFNWERNPNFYNSELDFALNFLHK